MRAMVANVPGASLADRPWLVDIADAKSEIWHCFAYIANSQGNPMQTIKPVCKRCFKATQTKGANTSKSARLSLRQTLLRNSKCNRLVSDWDKLHNYMPL